MQLISDIKHKVSEAIKARYDIHIEPCDIDVQRTNPSFDGDFSVMLFNIAKKVGQPPGQVAAGVGNHIMSNIPSVSQTGVWGGFLNITFSDDFWASNIGCGTGRVKDKGTMLVEFCSPNTNKPLHIGHVRNMFLGDSVSRILSAAGHNVIKMNLYNDRGIHICKSMLGWKKWGEGKTPAEACIKGDHFVVKYYVEFQNRLKDEVEILKEKSPLQLELFEELKKWEAGDPETIDLWKKMNGWVYEGFNKTFEKLGISFDKVYYESDTYLDGKKAIEDGLSKGVFKSDNMFGTYVPVPDADYDNQYSGMPVGINPNMILLLRKDGTSVYMTQDIGTAIKRHKDYPEATGTIYTVGNEQNHHFRSLFHVLGLLDLPWSNKCRHLSYGMVETPDGVIKTREGNVIDADDLIEEMVSKASSIIDASPERSVSFSDEEKKEVSSKVGIGAIKYHFLKVTPAKKMMFEPEESLSIKGDTASFIQYANTRIKSVLEKAGSGHSAFSPDKLTLSKTERSIAIMIYSYSSVIERSAEALDPSMICRFTYELAKEYNKLYQETSIIREEDSDKKAFLLNMSQAVSTTIEHGLGLLGVETPDKM